MPDSLLPTDLPTVAEIAALRGRGMIQMAIAALLFGVMAYLTRHATQSGLGGAQVAFVRFVTATLVIGLLIATGRVRLSVSRWDLLAARSVLGSAAALLYFLLLARLPVGTTTLLHYSSPIWSTIFAIVFLREHPARATQLALVAAFVGVALVVVGQGRSLGGEYAWLLLGVGSAALSGGAVVAVRAARRYDSAWTVFAAFSFVGVICTFFPAFGEWRAMTAYQWLLCLSVGGVALIAQVLMTQSLGVLDNATAGTIGMLTVLSAMALGYIFDGERFSGYSTVGAGLTFLGISTAACVSKTTNFGGRT